MSYPIARSLSSLSLSSQSQTMASLTRFASSDSKGKAKTADEDMAEARRRLSDLDPETIRKSISQMTFDKGSGQGNKTKSVQASAAKCDRTKAHLASSNHSKARLQTPLEKLLPLIPKPLHESIRYHRNYVKKSDSLVFISEEGKKQKENRDACFRKQYATLQELGKDNIPPEKNAPFYSR